MATHDGYWFPVASSRDVTRRPRAIKRFGQNLVLWRAHGQVVCMPDRCPHRSAALSLGKVDSAAGTLRCPFHGLEFAANGQCVRIPVEADQQQCADLQVKPLTVTESADYIWLWRGEPTDNLPEVPVHPALAGLHYGESTSTWPAHYTRCIENVCDYSHLPFVHKWTIGGFKRNPIVEVEIEDVLGGFRAHLLEKGRRKQCLEFLYPNLWLLMISDAVMSSAVFAPIDDQKTFVYGRTYHRIETPLIKPLANLWSRISQMIVFREDWPIVSSQSPGNVADAQHEKLLPSDAPVLAYRKLHSRYS